MRDERRKPALVIVIELECRPELHLVADCLADEHRLRAWLRAARALHDLPAAVGQVLDLLDQLDRPEAA